jgi:hypothetical protein
MAIGKKTGGRDFKPGQVTNPNGRPRVPPDLKQSRKLNKEKFERTLNKYMHMTAPEIMKVVKSSDTPMLDMIVAKIIGKAFQDGDHRRLEFLLARLIGSAPTGPIEDKKDHYQPEPKKSFQEFCLESGYPAPYDKQVDMMHFAFNQDKPRMILGARGYGKTDYVTILGVAYDIYVNENKATNLIISKSRTRNAAMISEIAHALKVNGVTLDVENKSCLRIRGLTGKDHSVEAITIKTSMRGRHPKRVLMDDPVTEEDVSEAMRVLVKRKYNEVLKLCDNVCVIGQPAHAHDLYAELRSIVSKMELPYNTIPELDHDIEAQRLAGVDEHSIRASYFLEITSEAGSPFAKINHIDEYPDKESVAFIDPSFEGGDYTALTILTAFGQGVAAVGFAYKKAWNHCLEEMLPQLQKYKVRRIAFETNSLGSQPVELMQSLLKDTGIGVIGRRTTGNKHARIMAAGTFAHLIHLSKQSDRVYLNQVEQYEYKSKHDDCPDSLASCLEWIGLIRGRE